MELDHNSDSGNDPIAREPALKKIEDDLLGLALRGTTSNKEFMAMNIAYMINRQSGGAVIGAWQIDQLSEDWINSFVAMASGLPKMKEGMNKIKKIKDEIVSKHSTYKPIPKRR